MIFGFLLFRRAGASLYRRWVVYRSTSDVRTTDGLPVRDYISTGSDPVEISFFCSSAFSGGNMWSSCRRSAFTPSSLPSISDSSCRIAAKAYALLRFHGMSRLV